MKLWKFDKNLNVKFILFSNSRLGQSIFFMEWGHKPSPPPNFFQKMKNLLPTNDLALDNLFFHGVGTQAQSPSRLFKNEERNFCLQFSCQQCSLHKTPRWEIWFSEWWVCWPNASTSPPQSVDLGFFWGFEILGIFEFEKNFNWIKIFNWTNIFNWTKILIRFFIFSSLRSGSDSVAEWRQEAPRVAGTRRSKDCSSPAGSWKWRLV